MNTKDLLIDFLTHCRTEHTVPVVKADIEPIVEGYLSSKNIGNTLVSGSLPLVEALEEYNGVLVEELNELVGMAAVHGWRSSRVDIGQQMRNRIAELKRQ